jgi:hypothetical protein
MAPPEASTKSEEIEGSGWRSARQDRAHHGVADGVMMWACVCPASTSTALAS